MRKFILIAVLAGVQIAGVFAQAPAAAPAVFVLQPDRVFDGESSHAGWIVVVRGERIEAAGPAASITVPAGARTIALKGTTLMPGMIEGHSHLLLHPYNETAWNDQVLREPLALRVARGVNHARATLMAGITTVRDLGTEGAGYADVGLRQAINEGIVPGPRMLVAGPAMVVTGSYAPKGFAPEITVPQGAEEADGLDGVVRVARGQIARGVDFIKIYADYRWGPNGETRPGFTLDEIKRIVEAANSSGRPVVAHASSVEGMRRAIMGGVETIEHGDEGTPEIWKLMVEKNVAFCPTLAAGDATSQYAGWKKGDRSRAGAARAQAPDLQGRARCRREDVFRRRRRRLRARRQRPRARVDGGLRHDAGRRAGGRDFRQRVVFPPGRSHRARQGGIVRGSDRRAGRSLQPASQRCARCSS